MDQSGFNVEQNKKFWTLEELHHTLVKCKKMYFPTLPKNFWFSHTSRHISTSPYSKGHQSCRFFTSNKSFFVCSYIADSAAKLQILTGTLAAMILSENTIDITGTMILGFLKFLPEFWNHVFCGDSPKNRYSTANTGIRHYDVLVKVKCDPNWSHSPKRSQ